MKIFENRFVEYIPDELDDNIVYISMQYKTAVHLCACGCKNPVVTPITPNDWSLKFNGISISLYPSIGNWNFECRSHYWIKKSKIIWAEDWSQEMVESNRKFDTRSKELYYKERDRLEFDMIELKPLKEKQKKSFIRKILTLDFK